jgi:hypothetical protein
MAPVDPENDNIQRFIVRHYRYDPERHERRHVVVPAFDNDPEFQACMQEVGRRSAAGRTKSQRHAVLAPPLLPEQPVQHDVGEAVAVVGLLALDAFEHEAAAFG